MAETFEQQLDRVQEAIAAIEAGTVGSYTIGNQSFTKHNLETLYAREERLQRKIHRDQDRGRRVAHVCAAGHQGTDPCGPPAI